MYVVGCRMLPNSAVKCILLYTDYNLLSFTAYTIDVYYMDHVLTGKVKGRKRSEHVQLPPPLEG